MTMDRTDSSVHPSNHQGDPADRESLIAAIYEAIAKEVSVDPEREQIPVREQIDPDALHALFIEQSGDSFVSFPVWNVRVVVYSDGEIDVQHVDR